MSFSNTPYRPKNLHPNSVRIGLMDPNIAQTWAQRVLSNGTTVASIKKGDTINHTTSQPIANGLFCQRIFGPCNDYTCACGHEKIRIHVNVNVAPAVCPECNVEWTVSSVRRQRLGSIELLSPVTHKWFSDSRNYIPILSGINVKTYKSLKECKLFFPFIFQVVDVTPDKNKYLNKHSSIGLHSHFKEKKGSGSQNEIKIVAPISNKGEYKNSVSKNFVRSMKNLKIMTKSLSGATHIFPLKKKLLAKRFARETIAFNKLSQQRTVSENNLMEGCNTGGKRLPKICGNSLWSLNQQKFGGDKPSAGVPTKKNSTFYPLVSTTKLLQNNKHIRDLGMVPTVNKQSSFDSGEFNQSLGQPVVAASAARLPIQGAAATVGTPSVDNRVTLGRYWPTLSTRCIGCPSLTEGRFAVRPQIAVHVKDEKPVKQQNLVFCSSYQKSARQISALPTKVPKQLTRSALTYLWSPIRCCHYLRKDPRKDGNKLLREGVLESQATGRSTPYLTQINRLSSPRDITSTSYGLTLKNVKNTIWSFSSTRRLKNEIIPVLRKTVKKQLIQLSNQQNNVYYDNLSSTQRQDPQNTDSGNFCGVSNKPITKTCSSICKKHRSVAPWAFPSNPRLTCPTKERPAASRQLIHWRPRKELLLGPQKSKLSKGSSGFNLGSNIFNRYHSSPTRQSFTQPEDYRRQFIKFMGNNGLIHSMDVPIVRYIHKNPVNSAESYQNLLQGDILSTSLLQTTYGRRWSFFTNEKKRCFTGYNSPSPLWPARVERQLTEKETDKSTNLSLKHSIQPSIDVFFSETKSAAKEETIKRILLQTGGGGVQQYLEKINLGQLIFMLQNDLFEIAPRLVKSQSTRRILAFIVNKIFKNIHQNYSLLEQIQTGKVSDLLHPNGEDTIVPTNLRNKSLFPGLSKGIRSDKGRSKLCSSGASRFDLGQEGKTNQSSLMAKIESLEKRYKDLKKEYKIVKKICNDFQNRKNANKRRYKLAFQLFRTMSNPAGMTLSSVPVLPPGLRPIIDVPKIGPITADLNIRYRALIFALRNLRELAYVDFRNTGAAQASVQEAVDDLLYTGGKTRRDKAGMAMSQNVYKSLAIRLKGKHGRFRGNLLGKRVDYSGRSVIVVGPTLKIHQCGLPFEIAIKLFNPFLIRHLIQKGLCKNIYKAKQVLMGGKFKPLIWALCREVMLEHLVLLNRAPTLHRLGVQAFMPILVSGRAILLHPLVCTGFNADFDGDQMSVHVPLFSHPRAEAWKMMWSRNNFLSPSSGEPILLPSQDMVLGCYYLTESSLGPLVKPIQQSFKIVARDRPILGKDKTSFGQQLCSFPVQITNNLPNPPESTELPKGRKEYISKTPNNYFRSNNLIKPFTTNFQMQNSYVLSIKTILENYRRGFYTLQSSVWMNSNKMVQKFEGDGFEGKIPALELRITPYGITRMLHSSGIKKTFFSKSRLLPVKKSSNSPFEICSIRTTIGRLLFNDVLNKFEIF